LVPGQDCELEILRAVRAADIVVVCLCERSVTKTGFIPKEIKLALDVADMQPEGTIFIVPVRLEECDVPERFQRWQWVNLFEEQGYARLVRAMSVRFRQLV
jgi:TIR domain